jgi:hypothetical protein
VARRAGAEGIGASALAGPGRLIWLKAGRGGQRHPARMPRLTLTRKLVALTVVKLAALSAIYLLAFAPASHAPIDAVQHIAGSASHP